ncbi:ribonuclease H-like domain-containing protein [Tanacetum coccineum]
MPTIPTQTPFTYPNPNPSASPSFFQDDTSESFIPEPTQPMLTFTQTAFLQPAVNYQQVQPNQSIFSQPAVHFQQTQPTQNQTGQQYTQNPNNVQSQQFQTTTISANNVKFPYLEKEKYEIWAMKMEYWIQNADHNLWRIVQQGNSPKRLGKDAKGNTIVHPPVSLDEHVAVQRENKVRTLLLQALPEDHMPDFHHYDDARDIWMAVKARFGGNEESKKMRKTMLKQQFTEFSVTEEEGLHKGYDRFQKILSQLNQVQARPDNDDINLKFLRALPSSWSQVALALKTRGGLDSMSFDDLYNKLRSLELDVRIGHSYGVKAAAAPTHSAFIGAASSGSKLTYSDQQSKWKILPLALYVVPTGRVKVPASRYVVPTGRVKVPASRYVVPTGRVKVPAGRYVVPTGKDNVIVSAGRSNVIPAGRTILVLEKLDSKGKIMRLMMRNSADISIWDDCVEMMMMLRGGIVTFGGGDGKITGKGTIRTSKLNFENVYYVEELQNFNLFFVSQICDKKEHKSFYTDLLRPCLTKEFPTLLRIVSDNLGKSLREKADEGFIVGAWVKSGTLTLTDSLGYTRFKSNQPAGPKVNEASKMVESNSDYAEELARLQRQEHEAKDTAEKYGFGFSKDTAGSVNPAANISAGSIDPAASISVVETSLPPGLSLGSSAHSTRFPSPSDLANSISSSSEMEDIYHHFSTGIFLLPSSYDCDFGGSLSPLSANPIVVVDPVPTKRIGGSKGHRQEEGQLTLMRMWRVLPLWEIDEQVYVTQPKDLKILMSLSMFTSCESFGMVFIRTRAWYARIFYLSVYVDDIIFGSTKKAWCVEFEVLMKGEFEMSAMGELTFFLGLQVKQKPDGIFISQDKYVQNMLKKFNMESVRTATTPYEASKPKSKDEPDNAVNDTRLHPLTSNLNAVKMSFSILKGQPKLGLWYPRDSPFVLEAYCNSDYTGSHGDRKSTTGGCQFLGRRLISWQCKKQTIVATSSTEAEYVATANYYGQVLKIHTDDNVADLLTKSFDGPRFNYLVVHIGMLNP